MQAGFQPSLSGSTVPVTIHYALQLLFTHKILKLENDFFENINPWYGFTCKSLLEWQHFHTLQPNKPFFPGETEVAFQPALWEGCLTLVQLVYLYPASDTHNTNKTTDIWFSFARTELVCASQTP